VFRGWLDAGVRLIQLRTKALGSGALLTLAQELAEDARSARATFILNDRADLARLAGASGVHVGQTDLPPADARRLLGADFIVGLSTHSEAEIAAALAEPVDYLGVGAVFGTTMKGPAHPTVGLALVARAAELGSARATPIVAIGGITLERASSVLEAGASSVAVITDLLVGDPAARAREYLAVLGL
jgi:thiamine-phosphate pyrophosphorylase